MERVIYSPSEDELEEAQSIAESNGLLIQVGDSEATKNMDFDRSKVQIISIPSVQELRLSNTFFKLGQLLRVEYIDEFDSVNGLEMRLRHETGLVEDSNGKVSPCGSIIVFPIRPANSGKYAGEIFDNDGVIATFTCEVRA